MSAIHTMTNWKGVPHQKIEEAFSARRAAEKERLQREAVEAYKLGYADGKKQQARKEPL